MIARIFIATAELVISAGIENNEANSEIETQPVPARAKKASVQHS